MNRKTLKDTISDKKYDVIIIGGGITGANIFWDATLRNMKALLVDKNDYASGTSQATSKLIHGGLRYLKNFELRLVRESLRERRILGKISPHAVRPLEFLIPIYSTKEKLVLAAGMFLYNRLSFDRNHEISHDVHLPPYRYYNREETIYRSPGLNRKNLKGSFVYFDYANVNPERHTTEFIFSARNRGGVARNYTEVVAIDRKDDCYLVSLRDNLDQSEIQIESKTIVNASGPWADFTDALTGIPAQKKILRSKGIHVVVRKICGRECIVSKKRDGSHMFIIPWRNKTIIGTTDTNYAGNPDDFRVTRDEVAELLADANATFGLTELKMSEVDFYYGGLRPLVEESGSSDTYNASRKSEIMDYRDNGLPGYFAALGGKYTTSRAVAKETVDKIVDYLPGKFSSCSTEITPLDSGNYPDLPQLCCQLQNKFPTVDGEKLETLAKRYGSLAKKIIQPDNHGFIRLSGNELLYEDELDYILKNEDIVHATDFYFRRSGVGVPGLPKAEEQKKLMQKLQSFFSWNDKATAEQEKMVTDRYKLW